MAQRKVLEARQDHVQMWKEHLAYHLDYADEKDFPSIKKTHILSAKGEKRPALQVTVSENPKKVLTIAPRSNGACDVRTETQDPETGLSSYSSQLLSRDDVKQCFSESFPNNYRTDVLKEVNRELVEGVEYYNKLKTEARESGGGELLISPTFEEYRDGVLKAPRKMSFDPSRYQERQKTHALQRYMRKQGYELPEQNGARFSEGGVKLLFNLDKKAGEALASSLSEKRGAGNEYKIPKEFQSHSNEELQFLFREGLLKVEDLVVASDAKSYDPLQGLNRPDEGISASFNGDRWGNAGGVLSVKISSRQGVELLNVWRQAKVVSGERDIIQGAYEEDLSLDM